MVARCVLKLPYISRFRGIYALKSFDIIVKIVYNGGNHELQQMDGIICCRWHNSMDTIVLYFPLDDLGVCWHGGDALYRRDYCTEAKKCIRSYTMQAMVTTNQ